MQQPLDLITSWLARPHILDGGLATELEARGARLDGPLWSGRVLLEQPELVRDAHMAYLLAGAEVLITASYQVTFAGMAAAGFEGEDAGRALRRSVRLAAEARVSTRRPEALIAASIGPYGAFLSDGGEYRGRYGLSAVALAHFHRERFDVLADSGADLIAFETTPDLVEARAYAILLAARPEVPAWISFSCADGVHTRAGQPVAECARELDALPNLVAVGVNCTAPAHITALVRALRPVTGKPIVVYPNSGEGWDAVQRRWTGARDSTEFAARAREWLDAGANLIGGCCRTEPAHVRELAAALGRPAPPARSSPRRNRG